MNKRLPIVSKTAITLYPHHSLPLSIPFINKNVIGWYMNNFINIFYRYEYPTVYDYIDYKCFYAGIMDVDTFTFSTALNHISIECFVEFINSNKYIYAWVDQYYISATEYYQKCHNIHPVLVYGYNLTNGVYYCRCFSVSKSVYDAEINIDEYQTAICQAAKAKGCSNQDDFFHLFQVREDLKCDFMLNEFIDEVYNYTAGRGTYKDIYYAKNDLSLEMENVYHYGKCNISSYGLEVTKLLYQALNHNINIRCFDYRLLHMVCENKQLISQRLQYVFDSYICSDTYRQLIIQYQDIALEYSRLRLLAMKTSFAEKRDFLELVYSEEKTALLCCKIKNLYVREKDLLHKILNELFDVLVKQNFSQYIVMKAYHAEGHFSASFDSESHINSIVLCSYNKRFHGKLYVAEQIIDIDSVSSKSFFIIELNKSIAGYTFIPGAGMAGDICVGVFAICEHREKCHYIASSTYFSDALHIDVNNLAQYDTTFWCSSDDDAEPYVEVVFDNPIIANTVLIEQHIVEKRLSEVLIQAFINGKWENLVHLQELIGQQLIKSVFPTVLSDRYRVKIIKTVPSDNGFDMPNIMLLKIFTE